MSTAAHIERIDTLERLRALGGEWDALAAENRSPLLDHDWTLSCAESLHVDGALRVICAFDGGRMTAAAPLVLEGTASGPRLTLLGASRLHEPGGWLFASADALRTLSDAVVHLGRPMLLQRIASGSPLAPMVSDAARRRAATVVRDTAPSLAVPIRGAWSDYHATLGSQIRVNLPRLRRKAEREVGRIEVTVLEPREHEVDAALESLVTVEGSGWKGRSGSSLARRADLRGFFRGYCRRAARRGRLRVTELRAGGIVAAMELGVEAYGRLWQLKIGYQDALAAYYPGLLMVEASIRSAFERGLDAYEFLGSAEPWEERWRPETRGYQLLAVYPFNVSGMIGAGRDFAGSMWRRAQSARAARTEAPA